MDYANVSNVKMFADIANPAQAGQAEDPLDKHAFLKLFTTQLQNQNPLDPVKNEDFIAQLAQFSSLEATTSMASSLDRFVNDQRGETIMRGASLIGKGVFLPQQSFAQAGGQPIEGYINLPVGAESVELSVINADTGEIVNKIALGYQEAGSVPFVWNGGDATGAPTQPGNYTFRADAFNGGRAQGVPVFSEARIRGVSWDELSSEALLETTDGEVVPLSLVSKISD
jgi:flagellar basal-body rod modification protein FlgD